MALSFFFSHLFSVPAANAIAIILAIDYLLSASRALNFAN